MARTSSRVWLTLNVCFTILLVYAFFTLKNSHIESQEMLLAQLQQCQKSSGEWVKVKVDVCALFL